MWLIYCLCWPFLPCLTSVFMVSRQRNAWISPGTQERYHINLTRLCVQCITGPNLRAINPTASPVTIYSHNKTPSMETDSQPHWTSAQLCMLTTTMAKTLGWKRPPVSSSLCLFVLSVMAAWLGGRVCPVVSVSTNMNRGRTHIVGYSSQMSRGWSSSWSQTPSHPVLCLCVRVFVLGNCSGVFFL